MTRNFIFIIMALLSSSFLHAQSVVGGTSKSSTKVIKELNSFTNFDKNHLWLMSQNFPDFPNKDSYIGKEFRYYNVYKYTMDNAPYPWQNGRVRDGKYRASNTAFNNYIKELQNRSGEKFKLVGFVPGSALYQPLFVGENNDTILFNESIIDYINGEMLRTDYIEQAKKFVGRTIYYTPKTDIINCTGFINIDTREFINIMPYNSEWLIKDICVDTTFFGERNSILSISENSFPRLAFVLENNRYGTYEYFVQGLYNDNFTDWSNKANILPDPKNAADDYYNKLDNNYEIIKDGCKKGYEDALFTDLFFGEYLRSDVGEKNKGMRAQGSLMSLSYDSKRPDNNIKEILELAKKGVVPALYLAYPNRIPRFKLDHNGEPDYRNGVRDVVAEFDLINVVKDAYACGVRNRVLGGAISEIVKHLFIISNLRGQVLDEEKKKVVLELQRMATECGVAIDLANSVN